MYRLKESLQPFPHRRPPLQAPAAGLMNALALAGALPLGGEAKALLELLPLALAWLCWVISD